MLQVRGLIVLTEPPIRRVAKNGATFATCRATVPAVEPGTEPPSAGQAGGRMTTSRGSSRPCRCGNLPACRDRSPPKGP